MKYYNTNDNDVNDFDPRTLRRVLKLLEARGGLLVRRRPGETGRVPNTMQQLPPSVCGGGMSVCMDMVSAQTKLAFVAASRTSYFSVDISTQGAGVTRTLVYSPSGNSVDFAAGNGMWRTVFITDLVSTLLSLDSVRVTVSVGGQQRLQFFGGRFARGNANECTTACGFMVCAGPLETVVITVTNISAAAFPADQSITVEAKVAYVGEEGFACASDGSCTVPGGEAPPVIQAQSCDCEGGE